MSIMQNAYLGSIKPHFPVKPLVHARENLSAERSLKEAAEELIQKSKEVNPLNMLMIVFGDRGSGKTVTLNTIYESNRNLFEKEKVFWLRIGFIDDVDIIADDWTDNKIYEAVATKFFDIIFGDEHDYYNDFLRENIIKRLNSTLFKNKMNGQFDKLWIKYKKNVRNDPVKCYKNLVKIMYSKGYRFIIVGDNLDVIEADKFIEDAGKNIQWARDKVVRALKACINKGFANVPHLSIIAARGTTVNDVIVSLVDSRILLEDSLRYIAPPEAKDVLERRLKFIENDQTDRKIIIRTGTLSLKTDNAKDIYRYLHSKLFKASIADKFDTNTLLAGASGASVCDLLQMSRSIIASPVLSLKTFGNLVRTNSQEDTWSDAIKEHEILWALLLKNRRKYYVNHPNHTWIYNIHDNYNDIEQFAINNVCSSILLKRIILHYFCKEKPKQKLINSMQVLQIFSESLKFTPEDVTCSMKDLVKWELLYKVKNQDKNECYGISRRGYYYYNYIINQYIYHELVLEDTALPKDRIGSIGLFDYNAGKDKNDYFVSKVPMVRTFVHYLADVEKDELDRAGKKHWFGNYSIFPELKLNLQKQEELIANSLGVNLEDIPVKWR